MDEELIAQHLYPQDGIPVPKVDLIIRTGGDARTSNFLPWQANGNECAAYFCAPYWPEFQEDRLSAGHPDRPDQGVRPTSLIT